MGKRSRERHRLITPHNINMEKHNENCEWTCSDPKNHLIKESTQPACDGNNWEIGQVRPEWTGTTTAGNYREIALVICSFCGIVRKTIIHNL